MDEQHQKQYEDNLRIMQEMEKKKRRDMFAAAALQGVLANSSKNGMIEEYAKASVQYADALTAALDGEGKAE